MFRLVAILSIVLLHTHPFGSNSLQNKNELFKYIHIIIDNLARFAIPFFFVISGYFWGTKVRNGHSIDLTSLKMIKRLTYLFILWSCIYLLPYNVNYISQYGITGPLKASLWTIHSLINNPLTLISQGTKPQLWFLVGLICSASIAYVFLKLNMVKTLVITSLAIYIIGVLSRSYSQSESA